MHLFYAAFFPGLSLRWYFKKKMLILRAKPRHSSMDLFLAKKKKQMQTLLSNKTTFGMNANKRKGPTQSQFIPTGETHRS